METRKEKLIEQHVVVIFLSLVLPLVMYFNRHLDDNRLTSWGWVFGDSGYKMMMLLGFSLVAAFGFTRLRLQWRSSYLFLISFLATIFFWSEPEVIVDAARYFTLAKQLKIHGFGYFLAEWGRSIFIWTDLPLVPMLYGLVFKVLGENRLWIQLLNSLLFSGTVLLTYKLGEALWHEKLGRYAGFLLLGFPYIFTQVPLMLVDIPSMFFFMLAVYTFTSYLLQGGRIRFAAATLAILFAILAKYSLWLYLSLLIIVFATVFITKKNRAVVVRGVLVFGGILLAVGLLYFFFHEVVNNQIKFLTAYQKPGLKRWGESFVSTFLFQTHPLLTLAALLSIIAAVVKRDIKYLVICFLMIILVLMQIKRSRYAIPVLPMLALMSSYGIMQLQFPEIRKLVAACIVFTSFFFSLGGYLPFLNKMSAKNLQNAGKYLDEQKIAGAWMVPLPQEEQILNPEISLPLLDIYTKAELLQLPNQKIETVDQQEIATSSLRFTWEYPLPSYYLNDAGEPQPSALVIVGSMENQALPLTAKIFSQKFSHKKIFNTSTGRFTHTTIVTVYH